MKANDQLDNGTILSESDSYLACILKNYVHTILYRFNIMI
jgi:hypothetical protein